MDRRKQVLNLAEAAVDRMLAEYANDNGYRIGLKMRLRDVIDVDDLPLTRRERNFTFTAHLDFVAFGAETHLPLLAVEYDGGQHLVDGRQIERDQIKNRLCEAAELPLLRIDNLFARKEGKRRVLTYILWAHETGKAFRAAQERGDIPWDEPFDHAMLMTRAESGRGYEFMGLAVPALSISSPNARSGTSRSKASRRSRSLKSLRPRSWDGSPSSTTAAPPSRSAQSRAHGCLMTSVRRQPTARSDR